MAGFLAVGDTEAVTSTCIPDQLHSFVVATCRALGSEAAEATLVADQLVMPGLAGHDLHGVAYSPPTWTPSGGAG